MYIMKLDASGRQLHSAAGRIPPGGPPSAASLPPWEDRDLVKRARQHSSNAMRCGQMAWRHVQDLTMLLEPEKTLSWVVHSDLNWPGDQQRGRGVTKAFPTAYYCETPRVFLHFGKHSPVQGVTWQLLVTFDHCDIKIIVFDVAILNVIPHSSMSVPVNQ